MKIKMQYSVSQMRDELLEAGELINRGGDYFEDMGGHIIHESAIPEYFKYYLDHLPLDERREFFKRLAGDSI